MTSLISDARRNINTDPVADGMASITASVPYKLVEGYPKIHVTEEGSTAEEQYIIRASDINTFWGESMPGDITVSGYTKLGLPRAMPNTYWLTTSLDFEPFTGDLPGDPFDADSSAPTGTYDLLYRVTINYRSLQQSDTPDEPTPDEPATWVGQTMAATGQALTISPKKVRVANKDVEAGDVLLDEDADGNMTVNNNDNDDDAGSQEIRDNLQPIVKLIPIIEHSLKMENMSASALSDSWWDYLLDSLGKVNKGTSTTNNDFFMGAKAGTVLFMGFSTSTKYIARPGAVADKRYDFELRFSQRHVKENRKVRGWNHVWDGHNQKWLVACRVVSATKKKPLYETADFDYFLKGAF